MEDMEMSILQISDKHAATIAKYCGDASVVGQDDHKSLDHARALFVRILVANQAAIADRYGDRQIDAAFIRAGFNDAYDNADKPTPAQYAKLCDCVAYNIGENIDPMLCARLKRLSVIAKTFALGDAYDSAEWSI
jgi:hypothetical protein